MIYYTGDIHGSPWRIISSCKKVETNESDTIIILGDVGTNYYGDSSDTDQSTEIGLDSFSSMLKEQEIVYEKD